MRMWRKQKVTGKLVAFQNQILLPQQILPVYANAKSFCYRPAVAFTPLFLC